MECANYMQRDIESDRQIDRQAQGDRERLGGAGGVPVSTCVNIIRLFETTYGVRIEPFSVFGIIVAGV